MGKITLTINGKGGGEGCLTTYLGNNESTIECNQNTDMSIGTITHELFHVFDKRYQAFSTVDDVVHPKGPNTGCANCLASNYVSQDWMSNNNGFKCDDYRCVAHPSWLSDYDTSELFANMGENWALEAAKVDPVNYGFQNQLGVDMNKWMNNNTPWFLGNMGF